MTGNVYSYLRFSSLKQAKGHSSERQREYAARWAKERGLHLDEALSLKDEGLSAYHQRHVKKGALGTFLAAIEQGKVPAGSVLVVEGLDRLSRAAPIIAQGQLSQIINAGITVVTASDNREYSQDSLKANPMELVYSLLVMIRAHEESETKSKRISASIMRQIKGFQAGTWKGRFGAGNDPKWLRWNGTEFELIPERANAMREAVRMFLQGQPGSRLMKHLEAAGVLRTSNYNASPIYEKLKNPALAGIKRLEVGGETYELANYYPAILTAEEWSDLQAAKAERGRRGSKGNIPPVITGLKLAVCGYCGSAMTGQNLYSKAPNAQWNMMSNGYRRILCAHKSYARSCPHPRSRSVVPIERALLNYCSDIINLRGLLSGDRATPLRAELAKHRQELGAIDGQLDRLLEAMLAAGQAQPPAAFTRKAQELEAEKSKKQAAINATEHQLSILARHDVDGIERQWRELSDGVLQLDFDKRLQARQLIADTFERIVIYNATLDPSTNSADELDVLLVAKGGGARMLRVNDAGEWVAGAEFAALPA